VVVSGCEWLRVVDRIHCVGVPGQVSPAFAEEKPN